MKLILKDTNQFILRFDKGEEVFVGIVNFMKEHSLSACSFSAIGSVSEVELGYYNPFLKEYHKKPLVENFELISLNGTGAMLNNEPVIHAHGMIGRTDFTVLGGHIFRLFTLATVEAYVIVLPGSMQRNKNDEFNLNLLV